MSVNKLIIKFNSLYGPALLSGVLLFLSFPKIDAYLLAWFALVPLLIFLYDKDRNVAFKAGLLFGFVYFFSTTFWIYHALYVYGDIHFVLSILIVVLLNLYLSLYPALFSLFYCSFIKKTALPALFVAPVLWTTLEFIRSYALTGFPWASLGYSQYKFLPFIQIADITGIYGISFLLMAINGAIADIFLIKKRIVVRPLYPLMPTVVGFIVLFTVFIATFSYGFYRLHQERDGANIRAAVVQGNIKQDIKWDIEQRYNIINIYKELTLKASKRKPDIIIWPETAVPFVFGRDEMFTNELINFQKPLDSYLLFGSIKEQRIKSKEKRTKNKEQGSFTNSALLLDKNGKAIFRYDKIRLVPFGEYVPFRNILFFVDTLGDRAGDYIPGDRYAKATTPFGSFGTPICYEIIFPGLVRKFYTEGGDFIVTITNDAWFGETHGPYQHFGKAVFRAIENRKPVIRAANSGISGFIDSNGRLIDKTQLFERTFLTKDIKTDRTLSIYTKYGDIFSFLYIVCFIFLLFYKKAIAYKGRHKKR